MMRDHIRSTLALRIYGALWGVGLLLALSRTVFAADPSRRPQDIVGALKDGLEQFTVRAASLKLNPFSKGTSPETRRLVRSLQPEIARGRKVPADVFGQYARAHGIPITACEGLGLVPDLESLRGADFDPQQVDPRVRDFYEHTSRYRLRVKADTSKVFLPNNLLMRLFIAIAGSEGNLHLPLYKDWSDVESSLEELDLGSRKARVWTRTGAKDHKVILNGLYSTIRYGDSAYVAIVFPVSLGNQVTILKPLNAPDGALRLSARVKDDPAAGDYISLTKTSGEVKEVLPSRAFSQELEVYVDPADHQLKVRHEFYGAPRSTLQLSYEIQRVSDAPGVQSEPQPMASVSSCAPEGPAITDSAVGRFSGPGSRGRPLRPDGETHDREAVVAR